MMRSTFIPGVFYDAAVQLDMSEIVSQVRYSAEPPLLEQSVGAGITIHDNLELVLKVVTLPFRKGSLVHYGASTFPLLASEHTWP